MRIARFIHPGGPAFGVVENATADAATSTSDPAGVASPESFTVAEIEGHPFGEIRFTGKRWSLSDVRLLSPILPSKVVAVGRNYREHASELGGQAPDRPLIFLKPSTSVIGPGDSIRLPVDARRVDHEAELAVVIGAKGARDVPREEALSRVFGYTCANDVTARDQQQLDGQWTRAKGHDSFCPLGPWIETQLDPADLLIRCEVDGELRQNDRTSSMVFDVATLVSYVSHIMTLLPGDVLLTGTPAGVGELRPGQQVTASIEGIGSLANSVTKREIRARG